MTTNTGATTTAHRELTADELDAVSGGDHAQIYLGVATIKYDITDGGISGGIKVLGGSWHTGTIFT